MSKAASPRQSLESQLAALVYELYGLIEEETKIVEGAQ
jgi:hypothetical protein